MNTSELSLTVKHQNLIKFSVLGDFLLLIHILDTFVIGNLPNVTGLISLSKLKPQFVLDLRV